MDKVAHTPLLFRASPQHPRLPFYLPVHRPPSRDHVTARHSTDLQCVRPSGQQCRNGVLGVRPAVHPTGTSRGRSIALSLSLSLPASCSAAGCCSSKESSNSYSRGSGPEAPPQNPGADATGGSGIIRTWTKHRHINYRSAAPTGNLATRHYSNINTPLINVLRMPDNRYLLCQCALLNSAQSIHMLFWINLVCTSWLLQIIQMSHENVEKKNYTVTNSTIKWSAPLDQEGGPGDATRVDAHLTRRGRRWLAAFPGAGAAGADGLRADGGRFRVLADAALTHTAHLGGGGHRRGSARHDKSPDTMGHGYMLTRQTNQAHRAANGYFIRVKEYSSKKKLPIRDQ